MGLFKHAHQKHHDQDVTSFLKEIPGENSLFYDKKILLKEERRLFFKRWLKHPGQLGTLAPISLRLAKKAAACIENPQSLRIVEIGAGSGRLTRALLEHGVCPSRLKVVELDGELAAFTQKTLPHVDVIHGDASQLKTLLPSKWIGNIDLVFSTIPLMCLEESMRACIINASFDVLNDKGAIFHLTYYPKSPISHMIPCGVHQQKMLSVVANIPPAFIWHYKKKDDKIIHRFPL